ncbi:MAG TPA: radical SAM protein, partial [Candidatus Cloacimonadota bacterium]|nr:radical SAM protein [Candidatus Cloacimonadota bacterium]
MSILKLFGSGEQKLGLPSPMVSGAEAWQVRLRTKLAILRIALSTYKDPVTATKVLAALFRKKKAILGDTANPRLVRAKGRYYRSIASAGWNSPAFEGMVRSELNRIIPFRDNDTSLQTMIFSITSRCPLACEHCYEWNNLSAEETLTYEELSLIMKKFRQRGITNIQFSGGEPLTRFEDLLRLVREAGEESELWILTSCFGLTKEKAEQLSSAGLTGVVISLDHWDEAEHNRFRKHNKAFYWARQAALNSAGAGLVVALSLCATRDFVTDYNLKRYYQLAKNWGAGIVRILEPRQVGHYQDKSIELGAEQIRTLTKFYLKAGSAPKFSDMPLVEYTGYHQRKYGCYGAGDRYLYVDSKGDIHACPFCQGQAGNAIRDDLGEAIARLRQTGCHAFATLH